MKRSRLYVYRLAGAMNDHEFTDDVAICYASSKKEAIKTFKQLYGYACKATVSEVEFCDEGVAILTSY